MLCVIEDKLPSDARLALEMLSRRDQEWARQSRNGRSGHLGSEAGDTALVTIEVAASISPEAWERLPEDEQVHWKFDGGSEQYFDTRYISPPPSVEPNGRISETVQLIDERNLSTTLRQVPVGI